MDFFPAREIIPGLWIGSSADASNPRFMACHDIGLIINCSKDIPCSFSRDIPTVRIPIHDAAYENLTMLRYLPRVVRTIEKKLRSGVSVLVHCYAGVSRSSSVVAAYLMYKYGLEKNEAITFIQQRKSETFSNGVIFNRALNSFDMIKYYI